MEGMTLEKLRVVLEAKYDGYKKAMKQVEKETQEAREKVNAEKEKINKAFNNVSTEKAKTEIEKLQATLTKQKEAVSAQEAVVVNLKNKYEDLMSGITKDATVSSLEKQLTSAEKELDKLDAQLQPLLDKLTQAEELEAFGLKLPDMDAVRASIDEINPRYDELEDKVQRLKEYLASAKLNPSSTTAAQKLEQQLSLAEAKLRELKGEAVVTEKTLSKLMSPKEKLRNKISQVIGKLNEMRAQSNKTTSMMNTGFNRVAQRVDTLKRRMTGLIASAFFFNVFSQGLSALREKLLSYLHTNTQFSNSLNDIKTNLQVAFMPIYNYILPALNTFMTKLASVTSTIAHYINGVFGTTYDESYKAVQNMEKAAGAAEETKERLGLASFDKLNNITTSGNKGSTVSEVQKTGQAVGKLDGKVEAVLDRVKEFVKKVKQIGTDFKLGDFFAAGQDTSSLIAWVLNGLSEAIDKIPWHDIGIKIGEFLKGMNWKDIISATGNFFSSIFNAAVELWKGSFSADPIATTIVTALSIAKFTGLSGVLKRKILSAIPTKLSVASLSIMIGGIAIAFAPDIAKGIAKKLGIEKTIFGDDVEELSWSYFFDKLGEGFTNENGEFSFKKGITFILDVVKMNVTGTADLLGLSDNENPIIRFLFTPTEEIIKNIKLGAFVDTDKWNDKVSPWFAKEKWAEYGTNIKAGLSEKWEEFSQWWSDTGVPDWWNNVTPWFDREKWNELGANAKEGITSKWIEFTGWWKNTGIYRWWNEDVIPYFSKDRWSWNGIKEGLAQAFNNGIAGVKSIWNRFATWLNEHLNFSWESFSIAGKEIIPAGSINLGKVPTFEVAAYKNGGLVPAGQLFQAREAGPELVGKFGSSTGVMNNDQIVRSVSGGVESGTYRAISPVMLLMREIILLLQQMADNQENPDKPSPTELFNMIRREASEYTERTGEGAFDY